MQRSSGRAGVWGRSYPDWPGWFSLRAEGWRSAHRVEGLRINIAHFPIWPWVDSDGSTEGGSLSSAKAQDVHVIWAAERVIFPKLFLLLGLC